LHNHPIWTEQMRFEDRHGPHLLALVCGALLLGVSCQHEETGLDQIQVQRYEQRMDRQSDFDEAPPLTPMDAPVPVELAGDAAPTEPSLDAVLWQHIPDPDVAEGVFKRRMEIGRFTRLIRKEYEDVIGYTLGYIAEIKRPHQVRLTLADCLRRALAGNYQVRIDGFAPAISTAQVVQAEAAFDTAFFANVSRDNRDTPTPSSLVSGDRDTTIVSGGIRKLLATGAAVTLSSTLNRTDAPGFAFNLLNPSWAVDFQAELVQPLLRGFGIDFNRAQINISKNQRKIDEQGFRASVINILVTTEQAYWALVGARRDVVISAVLLAQANLTYRQIEARIDYDAYQTLLYQSDSSVKAREFEFIDVKNRVRNAEDQLLNLMNDGEFPLSANMEIIPSDGPTTVQIVRDRFHEVETALKNRPEILQTRHAVDTTRLQLGIAKNQALPQLDVTYRMTIQGLGGSADRAFDQMTSANFINHFVGLTFLWNFGERAERAGIRIAALQQSQAVLAYKRALDDIITDCKVALRNLNTNYEQLRPSYQGVIAASENLRSLEERQERKSPAELNIILQAQTSLATARRALLTSVINYNIGIVDVERAKGTLTEYDNVVLAERP
ncbi:MAG: TolC family protein, partial [Planctomycetota bacterium]|nr:TolC family protein [Planctomycetota bacterium]